MAKLYTESLQRYGLPEFRQEWASIQRGIEKECLRVDAGGQLSSRPHPEGLGSALTNPFITTDFAESLLEFITPVSTTIDECLADLSNIHRYSLQHLDEGEMFWVASMPCPLKADSDIPVARYGDSNIGRMKTLYRRGLSHRYGSLMQAIAGLHYNFSMPEPFWKDYQQLFGHEGSLQDFRTERYLHLIRNFHRNSWLLIYLFGASPAACRSFTEGREHRLEALDENTLYLPNATCLRMGDLGYRSDAQKSLFVCYNELQTYVDSLYQAIHTPYADYEKIGQKVNGEYRQINTNLLQLENEFYSTIRPKPKLESGQRPLDALVATGIEYIEVRALDLNPYLPLGIDAEQIRFLDAFLLHCLLAESPACDQREFFEVASNIARVVEGGRDPGLMIKQESRPRSMREWADELLADIAHSAAILDEMEGGDQHERSRQTQVEKVRDASLTPSGRMMTDLREGQVSFFQFALNKARDHATLLSNGLAPESLARFEKARELSLAEQRHIEESDSVSFDEYLRQWNAR